MKIKLLTTKVLGLAACLGMATSVAMVTGCAGDRYHESTGESIDDTSITAHVKSALSNDGEYKFDGVKVTTFKGVVQLSGFVDNRDQKSRAVTLAKGVENVKDVQDNISVKE